MMGEDLFEHVKLFVRLQLPDNSIKLTANTQLCTDLKLCGDKKRKFLSEFVKHFGITDKNSVLPELLDSDQIFGDMIEWIPGDHNKDVRSCITLADLEKMLLSGKDQ